MGRKSRMKGVGAEREAVQVLASLGIGAKRNLTQYQTIRECDLVSDVGKIEVKRRARAWGDLYSALSQNDSQFVMLRSDHQKWLVAMDLETFAALAAAAREQPGASLQTPRLCAALSSPVDTEPPSPESLLPGPAFLVRPPST